uniref:Uncharacterized protein n=1 Tax=Rhizophora mucronata TaxID=61149 RepID=A0A2P2QRA1_RHIMU
METVAGRGHRGRPAAPSTASFRRIPLNPIAYKSALMVIQSLCRRWMQTSATKAVTSMTSSISFG